MSLITSKLLVKFDITDSETEIAEYSVGDYEISTSRTLSNMQNQQKSCFTITPS